MRSLLFRIKSQPGVAYESVAYKKKNVTLFYNLLNIKKYFFLVNLFLCLLRILMGRYCQKSFIKSGGFGKNK